MVQVAPAFTVAQVAIGLQQILGFDAVQEVGLRQVEERIVAAAVATPSSAARSGKARDEMSYTITIEDGGSQTVLSQSDTAMSADFGKLLAWLQRHPGK